LKNLLIITPNFPPINTPDMQRVRMSLPFFHEFGWKPIVLCVDSNYIEGVFEPLLCETIPKDISIYRTRAINIKLSRIFGIGNVGIRALPFLYKKGDKIIRENDIDLIYFSTTMFLTLPLGRIWKKKFGIPFVVDFQDLWLSEYRSNGSIFNRSLKSSLAKYMHGKFEPWTMEVVDGIIAVSDEYISTLQRRYPRLKDKPAMTIIFGASKYDLEILNKFSQQNKYFSLNNDCLNGVYVGRGGKDMAYALKIIFRAFRLGIEQNPELFSKIKLYFIGTDYAPDNLARKTIEPIANLEGVNEYVNEFPSRVPYFEALELISNSDFLIVPGSDDPQYTASKIYPYIMAQKPLLAVFHKNSSVVEIINKSNAGFVLPFVSNGPFDEYSHTFFSSWQKLLKSIPYTPKLNWKELDSFSAREMTRRQCELFENVLQN